MCNVMYSIAHLLCEGPDVVLQGGHPLLEVAAHGLRQVGVIVVLGAQLLVHWQHLLQDHQDWLLNLTRKIFSKAEK